MRSRYRAASSSNCVLPAHWPSTAICCCGLERPPCLTRSPRATLRAPLALELDPNHVDISRIVPVVRPYSGQIARRFRDLHTYPDGRLASRMRHLYGAAAAAAGHGDGRYVRDARRRNRQHQRACRAEPASEAAQKQASSVSCSPSMAFGSVREKCDVSWPCQAAGAASFCDSAIRSLFSSPQAQSGFNACASERPNGVIA
jgi:hypothetical protein